MPMILSEITPAIITLNEEANIGRLLDGLGWAQRVVVVDSGSTDRTHDIATSYPNVAWYSGSFSSLAEQLRFAQQNVQTPWMLRLDADYLLPSAFIQELEALTPDDSTNAYLVARRYCVFGRPLRASILPPALLLFRTQAGEIYQDGHADRLRITGAQGTLSAEILHDDRKPLERWFTSQMRYARQEAEKLLTSHTGLSLQHRLRKTGVITPLAVPVFLLCKGVFLDGFHGWFYLLQRTIAECMISLCLLEQRLTGTSPAQVREKETSIR